MSLIERSRKRMPLVFLLLLVGGCSSLKEVGPKSTVKRLETIQIAELYLNHRWVPTSANVYHGIDGNGIPVNTPDEFYRNGGDKGWWRVGVENVSIPYKWGGFDTPKQFDQNLDKGYYAGDAFSREKRHLLSEASSLKSTGVDCSGFVSRCLCLDRHYSTRDLPSVCQRLSDYSELKPGDILNKKNDHVMLFSHFEEGELVVYEAAAISINRVRNARYTEDFFRRNGYIPYQYQGIE